MRLYLVRHGETVGTVIKKYHGITDVNLDKKGVAQVKRLAKKLDKIDFSAAYSSNLKRCVHTAKIILKNKKTTLKTTRGLREIDFGRWEGMTFEEMQSNDGFLFDKWFRDLPNFTMPGGESTKSMQKRITQEMERITKRHKNGNILVVSHGGPIRVVLCNVLNVSMQDFWHMSIDTASLSIIEKVDGFSMVKQMNMVV
ncbi:MAG: alpha-ribazole phosphatase [Candidatus Ancaeobacter aquaticus]|nr:alpha-ribazole phosphatase [Candidatus Ancaeobacter aquaticus]